MKLQSVNPFNQELLDEFEVFDNNNLEQAITEADQAFNHWRQFTYSKRADALKRLANLLKKQRDSLAKLITCEMGKLYKEALAEIDKCALACEYYADNAEQMLAPVQVATDASRSYVTYQPLGIIMAVMPWNFPFWQVFRFLAPVLMAGNTAVLKHASNVPQCALAIERLVKEAGLPEGCFRTLMVGSNKVEQIITDKRIKGVALTGSELAGRQVAKLAGYNLKKSVMELGGSDAFIVLDDADLNITIPTAVTSRYMNAGQTCISAKRFIVQSAIADQFVEQFKQAVSQLTLGDPLDPSTTLAPMARADLRSELHQQVSYSLKQGAINLLGCEQGEGNFYQASVLANVKPGVLAYQEEIFGPVASIIEVANEQEAIAVANDSAYGLGASVWSQDNERAEQLGLSLEVGNAFINGLVKSDVRLPFGGVKRSGYGRELAAEGIKEFMNIKSVWIK
ncbi:NAD-dependent succinate-semialdehyde dehydrogenase [Spartinivicinus poritis]|uniref:NAD-dependent succinate-semialdehyde dehydrogenase n=1 Tax=Spartinivicinus poritis TaxID=2994640 RepID=A0ABT5UB61_9GAMM|nr:NAD-dependent succinate-semialdehyde dehydrogenase [Spartinivicinus sp. A2-2]MDE1463613.1 NAD-dependent succinate-semialdehyde dehydrogenase [Spartinivicinus sp. A2-2]